MKSLTAWQLFGAYIVALLGNMAYQSKKRYEEDPNNNLLYGYINFAFGIALASCIFETILNGILYVASVAVLSSSAPIVLKDLKKRWEKITGNPRNSTK